MNFGELIKTLRLDRGLTQIEVANSLDISRSVLSQYENNLVDPTAGVVTKLANFFNISADYLLGLEDDFGVRAAAPMGDGLTSEERQVIENYRALNSSGKKLINDTIKTLLVATAGSNKNKKFNS